MNARAAIRVSRRDKKPVAGAEVDEREESSCIVPEKMKVPGPTPESPSSDETQGEKGSGSPGNDSAARVPPDRVGVLPGEAASSKKPSRCVASEELLR